MRKLILLVAVVFLAGCGAPPPVRIASSIIGRTVGKQLKDEYQKAHPAASPSPTPVSIANPQ